MVGIVEVALKVEHPDGAAFQRERRRQLAPGLGAGLDVARIDLHVRDDHGLAGLRHPPDDPLSGLDPKGFIASLRVENLAHDLERLGVAVDEIDGCRVVVHDLVERLEDRLDHPIEVERRREGATHLEQHLFFERPPLGLLVEQGVVEREGDVLGGDLEAIEVGVAERLVAVLLQALDGTERAATPEQRNDQRGAERRGLALQLQTPIARAEPDGLLS